MPRAMLLVNVSGQEGRAPPWSGLRDLGMGVLDERTKGRWHPILKDFAPGQRRKGCLDFL
jgi:hypothetical protein